MADSILYCELMTSEQVSEFETLMEEMGYDEYDRPAKWAERIPNWMANGTPRGERDDPLAAIILTFYHESSQYALTSAYRSVGGELITPEMMRYFILALDYTKIGR